MKNQKMKNKPTRDELKVLIRVESFEAIGRRYGVTGSAVRKWCKEYKLPFQRKVINEFNNEEWDALEEYDVDNAPTVYQRLDEYAVIAMFVETRSYYKTSLMIGCDKKSVKEICERNKVTLKELPYHGNEIYGIEMLDVDTEEVIKLFDTQYEAAEWICLNSDGKWNVENKRDVSRVAERITRVLLGNRKGRATCGYKWRECREKTRIIKRLEECGKPRELIECSESVFHLVHHLLHMKQYFKQAFIWASKQINANYANWTRSFKTGTVFCENSQSNNASILDIFDRLSICSCAVCGITKQWQGESIKLQLHHKNGIHNDNRFENLMLVCPTCHSYIENRGMKDVNYAAQKKAIIKRENQRCCFKCHNTHWLDDIIPLQLHHIDGNNRNNFDDNIMLLCPNCHSQTETFGTHGRTTNYVPDEKLIQALREHALIVDALNAAGLSQASANYRRAKKLIEEYNLRQKVNKSNFNSFLKDAAMCKTIEQIKLTWNITKKEIQNIADGTHPLCDGVSHKILALENSPANHKPKLEKSKRKNKRPERQILKDRIRNYTFTENAQFFHVSIACIVKWCKFYQLPFRKHDIKAFNELDWENENWNFEELLIQKSKAWEDAVAEYYEDVLCISATAAYFECNEDTVRKICHKHNCPAPIASQKTPYSVYMVNKQGDIVRRFDSQYDAAQWIAESQSVASPVLHIARRIKYIALGCSNRKTAYGYYWKQANKPE